VQGFQLLVHKPCSVLTMQPDYAANVQKAKKTTFLYTVLVIKCLSWLDAATRTEA